MTLIQQPTSVDPVDPVDPMELICEKYRTRMSRRQARCRHPAEYCKFRSACIIHFLGQESDRERGADAGRDDEPRSPGKGNDEPRSPGKGNKDEYNQ